jgi:hypothetical protein
VAVRENLFDADLIVRRPDVADRQMRIVVDAHGLHFDGLLIAPPDAFVGAAVERIRDDGQCRLVLVFGKVGFSKITLLVPNATTAKAVSRALGIASRAFRFRRIGVFQNDGFRRSRLSSSAES